MTVESRSARESAAPAGVSAGPWPVDLPKASALNKQRNCQVEALTMSHDYFVMPGVLVVCQLLGAFAGFLGLGGISSLGINP